MPEAQRIPAMPHWHEQRETRAANQAGASRRLLGLLQPSCLHHSPHHPRFSGSCQSAVRWAGREESETGSIKAEPAAAPAAAPKATKRGLTERQARSQCSVIPTRVSEIWFFLSSWFFPFSCSGGLKEVCRRKNSRLLLPLWPHELCDLEQVTWVLWALL